MRCVHVITALCYFCVLCVFGCTPADEKIAVKGIVFCDGKPFSNASIAFIGNSGGSFSSATSNEKGEFNLRASAGKNKVSVNKMDTSNVKPADPNADQTMPTDGEYQKMKKDAPKPLVAAKFADPDKSGIEIDIVSGMSSIDVNVTSK